MRGHVGPDDNIQGAHTEIRPQEGVDEWRKEDPIARFEMYLLENGVLGVREMVRISGEVKAEVEEAFRLAKTSPYPEPGELGKSVFREYSGWLGLWG